MNERILVTGGAGFIGCHVVVELAQRGFRPVVLDSLSNSSPHVLECVRQITGDANLPFIRGDVRSRSILRRLFSYYRDIDDPVRSVIHLAGCKSVAESVAAPLKYYDVNVSGTNALLSAMAEAQVRHIVFSSSATVYGTPDTLPISESEPLLPESPYGRSKYIVEQMLRDVCASDPYFRATVLRYFNPIGAHPSGSIGEAPRGKPNNLFPYLTQVAARSRPYLTIFGHDYATRDGTPVRDYLHVVDLAKGHVCALALDGRRRGFDAINLGTGGGTTVIELVHAFERNTSRSIPIALAQRRRGDVPAIWADVHKARDEMGWRAELGLSDMCRDGWRWQASHPHGYDTVKRGVTVPQETH